MLKKTIIAFLLAALLLGMTALPACADGTALLVLPAPISGEISAETISKSGNVTLSITREEILAAGYQDERRLCGVRGIGHGHAVSYGGGRGHLGVFSAACVADRPGDCNPAADGDRSV